MINMGRANEKEILRVFLRFVFLTSVINKVSAQFETTGIPTVTANATSMHIKRLLKIFSNFDMHVSLSKIVQMILFFVDESFRYWNPFKMLIQLFFKAIKSYG